MNRMSMSTDIKRHPPAIDTDIVYAPSVLL